MRWARVLQTGLMRRITWGCFQGRDSQAPPLEGLIQKARSEAQGSVVLASTQLILMIKQDRETSGGERRQGRGLRP